MRRRIFIAMIRDEITNGTNLDENKKSKEKEREEGNQGRWSPRSLMRKNKNSSIPGDIFGCHN